ncbi:hypothetical protein [Streptomyces sp. NPDC051576]|uniref:hypothetical protein n=1 Tax=Streptomyces sp. NPDC051576 TaxID=3155803 RepID=UPI003446F1D6
MRPAHVLAALGEDQAEGGQRAGRSVACSPVTSSTDSRATVLRGSAAGPCGVSSSRNTATSNGSVRPGSRQEQSGRVSTRTMYPPRSLWVRRLRGYARVQ